MATELPLNGFYAGISQKNSDRRCVNWIPCNDPEGSMSMNYLDCPSGIDGPIVKSGNVYTGLSSGSVTSQVYSFESNRSESCVFAKNRYLFSTDGASIQSVPLPNTGFTIAKTEQARFASSQQNLVLVAPSDANLNKDFAYSFDLTMTPTPIDLGTIFGVTPSGIADVAYLGGRFIYMSEASTIATAFRCYYSDIGATAPKSTQFFSPDSATTRFKGLQVVNGQLLLFTEDKTFLFSQTTSATTPYQWNRSATVNVGLLGAQCKTELRGSVVFVGRRSGEGYRVFVMGGGDAQPISTKAIDKKLNEELETTDQYSSRVFSYSDRGRDFVAVKIGSLCFSYDLDTQRWHERRSNSESDSVWRMQGFAYSGQNPVFVSSVVYNNPGAEFYVGRPDEHVGTEFGQIVERYMISGPINSNNQPLRLSEIEPICEVDLTEPVAGYENPKIAIAPSYDFGNTFEQERSLNIGASGVYDQRTRFLNFGLVRQALVVKFRAYLPYPVRLLKMLARIQPGGRES